MSFGINNHPNHGGVERVYESCMRGGGALGLQPKVVQLLYSKVIIPSANKMGILIGSKCSGRGGG